MGAAISTLRSTMPKPRTLESAGGENGQRSTVGGRGRTQVSVPRAWLVALTVLVVVPWLVVGWLYVSGGGPEEARPAEVSAAGAGTSSHGPWGRLTVTPVVVSPPLEYVAADWGRDGEPDTWYFPATSAELLEAFLVSSGLPPDQAARLRSSAQADRRTNGLIVRPDQALVRSLTPEVRGRIYLQLAKSQLNFDQSSAFRFYASSVDQWLGGTLISAETRRLVDPLIYRDAAGFLNFADPELIRSQIGDQEELRRLAKALLRQPAMLVRLSIKSAAEVDVLTEYWGRGGRRLDLHPLLESVAGAGPDPSIDIVHLLPTFARQHLYRYPKLTTAALDKPLLANCLWSALNFFNPAPDDKYLTVDVALTALRQEYFVVQHGYQLGDVIAFVDDEGDLYHVAVYIADNLVFTKNGTSPLAPWTIVPLERLKGYYRSRSDNPRLIYHRRNDL